MDTQQSCVLLIDDEPGYCQAAALALREAGFIVEVAYEGDGAIAQAEKVVPDLILLDEKMPKKNGLEVLAEIRKKKWGKNIPVIMLTNIDSQEVINKALQLEALDYLIKFDTPLDKLVENVKSRLSR